MDNLHPLITPDMLHDRLKCGIPLRDALTRGTGRSTLAALETLTAAYRCPYKWVRVQWHTAEPRTLRSAERYEQLLKDLIKQLGWHSFVTKIENGQVLLKFGITND